MNRTILRVFFLLHLTTSCKNGKEKIHPATERITESVYASGVVKSKDQYQFFSTVSGIAEKFYVTEGDTVTKGQPLLYISNETSRLNKENAEIAAAYSDYRNNAGRLHELRLNIDFARNKMQNDSLLYTRQEALYAQQVGSKVDVEQRQLAYLNSKTSYQSALLNYEELERQLKFASSQASKNLSISTRVENDYIIRSEMDGIVYSLNKSEGEIVNAQTPLGVIGSAGSFELEMQVDEYDIFKIRTGQKALVTMDAYKGQVFAAIIQKINPFMNERSKSFQVDATFIDPPGELFPNITFEANIIIQQKENAITIPRNYLVNDSTVLMSNGEQAVIKTGLKDYRKVEVVSGLTASDEIIRPGE
jgi:multidrug efflux pump subunit AcrA (membrane-fusion protein)